MCLCNKDPDFIFLLNRLFYSMPLLCDRESYDGFVLPVERELIVKNLLFDLLIMARSFKNLFYLLRCSMSLRRFQRIHSIVLRGIKSDFAWTKVSGVVSQYILQSGRLWHPLTSSMLKNKQIFSLIIFKTNFCFLSMTLQLGVSGNHII